MEHLHHIINYWAVLVSAVILWALGALWYSPALFAKPWVAIVGRQMGVKPKGVYWGMIASFIGDLLLAFVLAHVIVWSKADSLIDGLHIALLTWVGFIAATMYPTTIYEGRPAKYFMINAGYWLIGLLGIGALLVTWR